MNSLSIGGYGIYLLFALPAMLLGLWAQLKVQSAVNRNSRLRLNSGLTGGQVARRMLDTNGLQEISVEQVGGFLSDHYDPQSRTLRLSANVFQTPSIAAAGIAAHEAGHAIQHQQGYTMLHIRTVMVPTVQLGSWLGPIIFFIGLLLSSQTGTTIAWVGLALFTGTALFAVITLPVEFNATRRAKSWLTDSGMIISEERQGINQVLDAAALTYVAGAIQAISTVLYYGFLLMGRRRN